MVHSRSSRSRSVTSSKVSSKQPTPVSTPVSTPVPQSQQKSSMISNIASISAGVALGSVVGNVITDKILTDSKKENSSTVVDSNDNKSICVEKLEKYETCNNSQFNQDCKSLFDDFKKCYLTAL